MAPLVFSKGRRSDESEKVPTESLYSFYDRSALSEVKKARYYIEDVMEAFPSSSRAGLIDDLTSDRDHKFLSGFFELFLFDYLRSNGYEVLQVHPELYNGKTPDFLVRSPDGSEFYLEATNSSYGDMDGITDTEKLRVMQKLWNTYHPYFTTVIEGREKATQSPSPEKVKGDIWNWMDSYSPQHLSGVQKEIGQDAMPKKTFDFKGWQLHCKVHPKEGDESIVRGWRESGENDGGVDRWTEIRDDLEDKASDQLSEVDRPTVIAINVLSLAFGESSAESCLYGKKFDFTESGEDLKNRRNKGLWFDQKDGRCRNEWISGVWFFHMVRPSFKDGEEDPIVFYRDN